MRLRYFRRKVVVVPRAHLQRRGLDRGKGCQHQDCSPQLRQTQRFTASTESVGPVLKQIFAAGAKQANRQALKKPPVRVSRLQNRPTDGLPPSGPLDEFPPVTGVAHWVPIDLETRV